MLPSDLIKEIKLSGRMKTTNLSKLIILLLLISIPLFVNLSVLPMRLWDEATLAINAYEMNLNGNWLVTYFDGKPDMWNLKPPLMIWLQVAMIKLFGYNELSIRLPSAIAGFITCIVLIVFAKKYLDSYLFGFIAVMVLVTSNGYIHLHATRTGEYDALLTLFTTLYCLYFFLYIESEKIKNLFLTFAFLALAILTKSVAGLFLTPALLIYAIIQKKFIHIIKSRGVYISIIMLLTVVAGYYLLRENYNHGYIEAVREGEAGGRFLSTIENHQHSPLYYIENLYRSRLRYWAPFVLIALAAGQFYKDTRIKKLLNYSILLVVTALAAISMSSTKLIWYDLPIYPFISIIIATLIYSICSKLRQTDYPGNKPLGKVAMYTFLILIFAKPYYNILNKTIRQEDPQRDNYNMSIFLRGSLDNGIILNNHYILYKGYNAHIRFYMNMLKNKGYKLEFADWRSLTNNDKVIISQDEIADYVGNHYDATSIYDKDNILIYNIISKKGSQ